jgi:hypothetical protein
MLVHFATLVPPNSYLDTRRTYKQNVSFDDFQRQANCHCNRNKRADEQTRH